MRITYLFVVLLLFACSEEKQAAKKTAWLIGHQKLQDACVNAYGKKTDSIVTRDTTIYDTILGEGIIIRDTLPGKDTLIIREVKCPPPQVIRITDKRDTTIYTDNPNQKALYEKQLRDKDKAIQEKEEVINSLNAKVTKEDKWKLMCIITWCGILLLLLLYFLIKKK
jgi:hypothetical protein